MNPRIHFNEVVTRDGFQNEPVFVPTDAKVALIDALSACGYGKIEVTSFTSPKAIPMLRDADEVMGRIRRMPGVDRLARGRQRRSHIEVIETPAAERDRLAGHERTPGSTDTSRPGLPQRETCMCSVDTRSTDRARVKRLHAEIY